MKALPKIFYLLGLPETMLFTVPYSISLFGVNYGEESRQKVLTLSCFEVHEEKNLNHWTELEFAQENGYSAISVRSK